MGFFDPKTSGGAPANIFQRSTRNTRQLLIEQLLIQQLGGLFGAKGQFGGAQRQFLEGLRGVTGLTKNALAEQLSGKPTGAGAILTQSLRAFDQEIAPRISRGFASQGASFGTRRGVETSRQLGNLRADFQSQLVGLSESAKQRQLSAIGIPLQQSLGQIAGLSGLTGLSNRPALGLLATPGLQHLMFGGGGGTTGPSGFSQLLAGLGTAAGFAFGGPVGGAAAGAALSGGGGFGGGGGK